MRAAVRASLILFATILQGCHSDGVTAPGVRPLADRVAAGPKRPGKRLKGRCEVTFPAGPFTQVVVPVTGSCLISHLGRSKVGGDLTATVDPDGNGTVTGTLVFTAANGSELHATASATADGPLGRVVPLTGTLEFTGGTGRFAGSSGTVPVTAEADLDHLTGTFEFDGLKATSR